MRKVKKMQLGAEPKATVNKKTAGIFLVLVALVAFAGIMGATLSNNVSAAINRVRQGKKLTKFDRIIFWEGGKLGDIDCNMSLPATTYPKCYQPIPQEYALGFINNQKTVERAVRRINIRDGKVVETTWTTGAQARFLGKSDYGHLVLSTNDGYKSLLRFIDLFDGASYMGNLYDVRVYGYGNARVKTHYGSIIQHFHNGGSAVASEWHFYPRGTLKPLDQLYYIEESDFVESIGDDPKDKCSDIKEKDPSDPSGKKTIVTGQICTYDKNAYRDSEGKVIYTGVFREGSEYGPVKYTAAEMEAHLVAAENSVKILGSNGLGTFKGTVAFQDIDVWNGERYSMASGGELVFTTWDSEEYAQRATLARVGRNDKNASIYSLPYFSHFCQDPTEDKICYYAWGGSTEDGKTTRAAGTLWFNFSSNSNVPFALIYAGAGHGSMIDSTQFYITHVLKDDLAEIPEGIIASAQNFQRDFENLYGHTLEDDKNFPVELKSETDRTLRFFPIYRYAAYTPYTMNDLIREVADGLELKWFSCPEMTEDCLIPYDPEHDNGEETTADGSTYVNGYDFIDGNKVYYASVDIPLEVNFPNTCYSDNTSTVEAKNE